MTANLKYTYLLLLTMLLSFVGSCTPSPEDVRQIDSLPDIYPDYIGVTVPENIAPLNFLLRESCEAVYATAETDGCKVVVHEKGNEVCFDPEDWQGLMENGAGKSITITLTSLHNGEWIRHKPFEVFVSSDRIDSYLTYRLIEPDYEVFSRLRIVERNIENFSERTLCDYNAVGNRCMNCHTHAPGDKDLSFLYVRGEGGGMVLNDNGDLHLLDLKTPDMVSGPVYSQFDPSGRYLVFSTNMIIPAFHSRPDKRLEVFDTKSDIYIYDLKNKTPVSCPLISDSTRLETFPTFSADGRGVFYCVANGPVRPSHLNSIRYSLCRIDFDPERGQFGNRVDTIVKASANGKGSVSHPRVSPDGKRLLYTVSDFGTFPIWHREADLRMIDLESGEIDYLEAVNSDMSDTYHSWSSSGRWFVFASKRDDGLYGKAYFAHVSPEGIVSKPFVLPQEQPSFYDLNLKSFNVPDLGQRPVSISPGDVADILEENISSKN